MRASASLCRLLDGMVGMASTIATARMDPLLQEELKRLIRDLVQGRYQVVVRDGRGGRLTAEDLERAVCEYGRNLVELPDEGWALADQYRQIADRDAVVVDLPMWTREEGRSDLTLSVTARACSDGYRLEIDDLHVL